MAAKFNACRSVILLVALAALAVGDRAYGQLGTGTVRPSTFSRPSEQVGQMGGRYSNYYQTQPSYMPSSQSFDNNPLSVSLVPNDSRGGGQQAYGQDGRAPSVFNPSPPLISPLRPLANSLGVPMQSSVPDYGGMYIPRRNTLFSPTIKADSFAKPESRRQFTLQNVAPSGPTVSAVEAGQLPGPASRPALPSNSGLRLDGLKEMAQRRSTLQAGEGAACLQRAMDALKAGQLRTNKTQPGAVDLFRQARLLLADKPEPTLGLIASFVSTADYNQAAVLVAPLVRKWPAVLASDFAQEYYARPEQMRMHLLAIREAARIRGDMDLRLLWAFYRWYVENRQSAAGEVDQMALSQGPDSPAATLAAAMKAALAGER